MMRISISGAGYSIALKPSTNISLHLPWYILFNGELKAGKHQLQLKIAPEKNTNSSGNACRIVYFLVNE